MEGTYTALVCATQKTEIIQPNKTMSRTKKYFSKEAKEKNVAIICCNDELSW